MKVFAQGSLTRVTMSMREVETMAASWHPQGDYMAFFAEKVK